MKALLITLICLLPFVSFAQTKNYNFDDFLKYVRKNYKIENEVRKYCDWQYAIVKVDVNSNNKIINYTILNNGMSIVFKNSFRYINGYQFEKNILIRKKPIVFLFTVQNDNDNCEIAPQNHPPSDITTAIFSVLNDQAKREPQTIFIYEPVLCRIYPTVK